MSISKLKNKMALVALPFLLYSGFASAYTVNQVITEEDRQEAYESVKDKKFNVYWNVLPTVIGHISGGIGYNVMDSLLLGVSGGGSFSAPGSIDSVYNVGVYAKFAVNGNVNTSGWVLSPFAYYVNGTSEISNNDGDGDVKESYDGYSAGLMVTYQFVWESGITMDLGVGPAYYSAGNPWSGDDVGKGVFSAAAQFSIGYSF